MRHVILKIVEFFVMEKPIGPLFYLYVFAHLEFRYVSFFVFFYQNK